MLTVKNILTRQEENMHLQWALAQSFRGGGPVMRMLILQGSSVRITTGERKLP